MPRATPGSLCRAGKVSGAGGCFRVLVVGLRGVGHIGALDRGTGVVDGQRLYLLAERRGLGEGEQLLRYMISWDRQQGFERLIGSSNKRVESVHQLSVKVGMELVGERICDEPRDSPEWGFAISLRS